MLRKELVYIYRKLISRKKLEGMTLNMEKQKITLPQKKIREIKSLVGHDRNPVDFSQNDSAEASVKLAEPPKQQKTPIFSDFTYFF